LLVDVHPGPHAVVRARLFGQDGFRHPARDQRGRPRDAARTLASMSTSSCHRIV